MGITTHITAIGREGARLAEAAALAGLDAPVPWCPGWDVRELLRHLSEIHLWAASHVAKRAVREGVPELVEAGALRIRPFHGGETLSWTFAGPEAPAAE